MNGIARHIVVSSSILLIAWGTMPAWESSPASGTSQEVIRQQSDSILPLLDVRSKNQDQAPQAGHEPSVVAPPKLHYSRIVRRSDEEILPRYSANLLYTLTTASDL